MKIKTNDMVKVLTGRDHGKKGKVIQVLRDENRVVVEGVNRLSKFLRARSADMPGQRIEFFGPINASNVELVCPKCSKPTRVGSKALATGKRVRVCKQCSETIE